jgi:hypothetical protein
MGKLRYWCRWIWACRPDLLKTRARLIEERDFAVRKATLAAASLESDFELLRLTIESGHMSLEARHPFLLILASECRVFLKDAPNYMECRLRDDKGELVLTIRKLEGKTPHELRREAEVERDRLQAQVLQLGGVL